MLELKIISPAEDGFLKEIQWNHEEIKAAVAAKMQEYEGLVYTDETIKTAKADRAELNKFKSALEDARKSVKKKCLEPYEAFESQMREITALVDAPIQLIDRQIKEVEQARRVEKQNKIMDFYESHVGGLRGILPFTRVMRPEYLNAGKSMKAIQEEITQLFDRVNQELDTIEQLGTKHELQVKDVYMKTLDLSTALRENARLEELSRELEARKQAEKMAQAESRQAEEEAVAYPEPEAEAAPAREFTAPEAPVYDVELRISGTREELDAFSRFLADNQIQYTVLKKPVRRMSKWQ